MIQDRISQIEATLADAPDLSSTTRAELLSLLAELKTEVGALEPDKAQHIAVSADAAFSRAARPGGSEEADPLAALRASVSGFEASHPQLVSVVDRIALALSNMGI